MLRTLLPQAPFSPHFTFIFRLLNFRDRDLVLREARKLGELRHENVRIMLFPVSNSSVETQRLRRTFDHVKAQLRTKGIKYNMMFPACFRFVDGESTRFFSNPEEAPRWIESLLRDR